jgi:hypothetical protein
MKHSAMHVAVENLLRTLPRQGLSIVAVIVIGWFLRELYRWDWRDENYVLRVYKNSYVDPTNLYKYYGSYGNS